MPLFFPKIYDSWKEKQQEKYEDILRVVGPKLKDRGSLLDYGVGKGWLEEFLVSRGYLFKRIVGVDVDDERIAPRRSDVEYAITQDFRTKERFDVVVCIDTAHLLADPTKLTAYAKKGGLVLVSEPESFKQVINTILGNRIAEGTAGKQEKDHFILIRT